MQNQTHIPDKTTVIEKSAASPKPSRIQSPVNAQAFAARLITPSLITGMQSTIGNRAVMRQLALKNEPNTAEVPPSNDAPQSAPQMAQAASAPPPPVANDAPPQNGGGDGQTINVPENVPQDEPAPEGFVNELRAPNQIPKAEPAPLGVTNDVTLKMIEAEIKSLEDYKPARKLRYFVKGKYYPSKDIELTSEDRQAVVEKLGSIRAMIASLTPEMLNMTPEALKTKQGELYQSLGDYVPFSFQMANLDILWSINVDENTGHYEYSAGGPRTCNITVMSMALEGLGITIADFTGDLELMQMVLEHQVGESGRVEWAVESKDDKSKAMPVSDQAIHKEARKDFKAAKIAALRFPDFMQAGIIYYYLTANDVLAGKKTGLNKTVEELKGLKKTAPKDFDVLVAKAHELAGSGILFSDNFQYYAQRLFGNVSVDMGGIHHMGKKELKKLVKSGGASTEQVEEYKNKALEVIPPLLKAGKTIEISRVGHFIYLANVANDGILVKDVGSQGRKYAKLDWKTAFEEGWLHSYVAYYNDPDAAKKLADKQSKKHKSK